MLQELLHFMPIKKTIADRKDNLTVLFKLQFESQETEPLKRDFRVGHQAEYS